MSPVITELFQLEVLNYLFDGVYVTDVDRRIVFWNAAAEKITGYLRNEVLGKRCSDNILIHVDDKGKNLCLSQCPLLSAIQTGEHQEGEVFLHHKNGHRVPVKVRMSPLRSPDGHVIGAVEVFSDNTPWREIENRITELERLSLWDDLTQLPNRRYLKQQLEMRLAEFERLDLLFGIAIIDIDHFKRVNDTYGHSVGDKVLHMVAQTIAHLKRSYDIVGRWGGEEFLLIAPIADKNQFCSLLDRVLSIVGKSYQAHGNKQLNVTVSIGAAVVGSDDTIDNLLERADEMLYRSKEGGRNQVSI